MARQSEQVDDGFGPVLRGGEAVGDGAPAGGGAAAAPPGRTRTPVAPRAPGRVAVRDDPRARRAPERRIRRDDQPGQRDQYLPAQRGRRRVGRLASLVGLLLGLVMLGLVALLVVALVAVDRVPVPSLVAAAGPVNTLVVGSDSREGLSDEQLQALGTERVEGRRTDTIFLVSVDGGRAAVLSFPRDLYVQQCEGGVGRINTAFATGGPDCLVRTVQQVSGLPVHHYLEVSFAGFLDVVDAAGGVPVFLDEPMQDTFAGLDLPAGCQVLDGREALGFVRARRIDNDLGRIARQQRFLAELSDTVLSPAVLANPVRLARVTWAGAGALTVDEDLGPVDALRIGRALPAIARGQVATYVVPGTIQNVGGASVIVQGPSAQALYASFADGSALVAPADDATALLPVPDPLGSAGVGSGAPTGAGVFAQTATPVDTPVGAGAVPPDCGS